MSSRTFLRSHLQNLWQKSAVPIPLLKARLILKNAPPLRSLLPGHLWLDYVEVVVTTKCNLRCSNCANLMQYYERPYNLDRETVIASMRKLHECFDWCSTYRVLGGEPFLNPDLKFFLKEIPREKCGKIVVVTNASILPSDPELLDVLRRKQITIYFSNYPSTQDTQRQLIQILEQNNIPYFVEDSREWQDYGSPVNYGRKDRELAIQFARCKSRCRSLFNGYLYYCPRSGHGYDLNLIERRPGEFVDILHNTREENILQIRSLTWRSKPIEACKYCLSGTKAATRLSRGD